MRYFDHINTVEFAKREYRRLAMANHPDRGGDTAIMQEINSQYHACLKRLDGQVSMDETNREHTYRYKQAVEQAVMDKIAELIAAGVAKTCEVLLIGTWVWVTGETKPVKDVLKRLGCKWHSKRLCWYWENDGYTHRFNRNTSLNGLAAKYGVEQFWDKESVGVLA